MIHFCYDIDEWERYDLQEDLNEMKNLYDDPAYEEVQKEFHDRLEALRIQYGVSDELNQQFIDRYLNQKN